MYRDVSDVYPKMYLGLVLGYVLRVGKPGPGRPGRMHVELRQAPSR